MNRNSARSDGDASKRDRPNQSAIDELGSLEVTNILLTLVVSLEAIVLTGFVLMSQNRLTQLADRRAHLDLQFNLLAEQELTAILKVVCLVAEKSGVIVGGDPALVKLLARTDVKVLAEELSREMATVDAPPPSAAVREERATAPNAACS